MSDARRDDAPTGPANPRGPAGPDAPAPPGGPQRSDAPAGSTSPGGPEQPEGHPSSPPDGPDTLPAPDAPAPFPGPDGEIHARTQAEQANEELQEENAETALDQPSDGSGGE
jgi:hypothetical protein